MDLDHPLLLLPLGSLLTLVVQALTRRWSRQDDREKRDHGEAAARRAEVDRRADGAAEAAVDELERYADLYAGSVIVSVLMGFLMLLACAGVSLMRTPILDTARRPRLGRPQAA